jgi:hypothetical protein
MCCLTESIVTQQAVKWQDRILRKAISFPGHLCIIGLLGKTRVLPANSWRAILGGAARITGDLRRGTDDDGNDGKTQEVQARSQARRCRPKADDLADAR